MYDNNEKYVVISFASLKEKKDAVVVEIFVHNLKYPAPG